MAEPIISINNLSVSIGADGAAEDEKEILHGISMNIGAGETHVLMGPNGAGKSTLGYTLMGNEKYRVTGGEALFNGQKLFDMDVHERARAGLFLSFQNPLEVPGVTLSNFIRAAKEQRDDKRIKLWDFRKELKSQMSLLAMDESYMDRDLNVGFSGGEKKKSEILQLLMLKPRLAILDETDSGLDVDAVRTVSKGVETFQKEQDGALLIITHSTRILESLHVDHTHVMVNGRIVATGDAALVDEINSNGFEAYLE